MSPWLQLDLSDPEDGSLAGVGYNRRQKWGRFILAVFGTILATYTLSKARMGRPVQFHATSYNTVGYDSKKPQINVAVVGGDFTGKSTLVGQILKQSSAVSSDKIAKVEADARGKQKRAYALAWLVNEEEEERKTDRTRHANFAPPVETENYIVNFIDVPTLKSQGAEAWEAIVMADAVIYVTSAVAFELEIKQSGNLRIFLGYAQAVGVNVIFAINKIETIEEKWQQVRYEEVRKMIRFFQQPVPSLTASKMLNVAPFIPVSAIHGINVFNKSSNFEWFEGVPFQGTTVFSIKEVIDACGAPSRDVNGALNVLVGPSLSYVKSGTLSSGGKVRLCPSGKVVTVDKLMKHNGDSLDTAAAGDIVSVSYSSAGQISSGVAFAESQTCGEKVKSFDAEVSITYQRESSYCFGTEFTNNWTATVEIGFQHVPCATKVLERWPGRDLNAFKAGTGNSGVQTFTKGHKVLLRFYPYSDIHIDLQSEGGANIGLADRGVTKEYWVDGSPLREFNQAVGFGKITSVNAADDDGPNFEWGMCLRIPGCEDYWEGRTDDPWQYAKFDKHGKLVSEDSDDAVDCEMWIQSDVYREGFK